MRSSPSFYIASNYGCVEAAAAIRYCVAIALDDDTRHRTDVGRFIDRCHLSSAKAAVGIDVEAHGDPSSFEAENSLTVFHARGTDTARAENASVVIEINIGMRRVDLSSRPLIGLRGCHHTEPIA